MEYPTWYGVVNVASEWRAHVVLYIDLTAVSSYIITYIPVISQSDSSICYTYDLRFSSSLSAEDWQCELNPGNDCLRNSGTVASKTTMAKTMRSLAKRYSNDTHYNHL